MPSHRHHASQRRQIWPPEAGYFRLRLRRGGWEVPCRIVHENDLWHAEVDGEIFTAHADPALAPSVDVVWHGGHKTDEADYRWRLEIKAHAAAHDPAHPSLSPRRPIDHRHLTPLTPRRTPTWP